MTNKDVKDAVNYLMTIMELAENGTDKEKAMSNELLNDPKKLATFRAIIA